MTALAEALLAAQRQASGALTKAYSAGLLDAEAFADRMAAMGCTDVIEQAQLLHALDVLREYGVVPAANGTAPQRSSTLDEPASQPQLDLIARLADERGQVAPQGPFTKAQASQVITALQRGDKVPF